ncbi:LUD domain-containing protein [Haloterrigena alkaliphila]|uniref:LUD domain-containing protein n=1 Tax=Haloterrigena alkaliphila TaxID=2816475 RepID=A0A8A2VAG7_9EURY|nr:LUD domain-containing protein [Haloterrigena alkaliphila]QSW97710.1 LUD domain-containing protein [Haloterrigena alkaliphila]
MSETTTRAEKAARIRHLFQTEGEAVFENTNHINNGRYEANARTDDIEELRSTARRIKEDAIERLPELIEEIRESVEANGGTVYLADDAADANRYITEVVEDNDAESVVKSKSMTSEEIDVNEALEANDVGVYETDLGEFVLQVADEAPSHLVGPAFHKSTEEIAELFNAHFDPETPFETATDLTQFARDYVGEQIRDADVGMTGANFVFAESGTIALVTNEGNARKCAVTPETHVAVAGIEKLIPSVREFPPFAELIAKAAGGQDIATYLSLLSPPVDSPVIDFENPDEPLSGGGPEDREFHLVLIDNGRTAMREDDELRETLYCIRCGACANSCANFQHVGGHAFGGETYTGGIATGWEAGVHGQESAAEFNDLCTGCSRCVNACPVKIDIPWINTAVRDRINRGADPERFDSLVEGLTPDEEPGGLDVQKRLFGNYGTLARLGSATAPVSNWLADLGPSRALMERAFGVDRRRELPAFERTTLRDWFADREPLPSADDGDRSAVIYPDAYTNYVLVNRGKAAVRTLEALGVDVAVAPCYESGRAPLSQGMIETARTNATRVADSLEPSIEAGRDVVVIEPSDLAAFRREYDRLLPADRAENLAEHSYEIMEYVYGLLENGADAAVLEGGADVAYHSHCQQRTLGVDVYTEEVLSKLDYDVVTSDVECCGMAGSFGYKSEYYELSMEVGDTLREQFEGETDRTLVASGASCHEQLGSLFPRESVHPIELVAPR